MLTRVSTIARSPGGRMLLVAMMVFIASACTDRKAGISLADPAAPDPTLLPTEVPSSPEVLPATATGNRSPIPNPKANARSEEEPVRDNEGREIITVGLPLIPPIELPPIGELAETGQIAVERLGDLVTTAISGVDVVAATCAAEGGALVYGDSGDDVFESDGSGQVIERSEDGLTTLTVESDGSGEFYDQDRASGRLRTVKVNSDQSGEYFDENGAVLTTILVEADRSGEYFRESEDSKKTVRIHPDGSGELFDQQPTGLLTIKALADGSGEYFFDGDGDGDEITVLVRPDGSWQMTDQDSDRRLEVTVAADGSGTFARRSFDPLAFDFDDTGVGKAGNRSVVFQAPSAPRFTVAAEFPPLGRFGALSPPCATIIRFDAQLLFGFGQATIQDEAAATLDEVVATLNEIGKPIEINGHTDSKGTDERNLALSLERARAVEAELVARGLAVERTVDGFGETSPIAPNERENGEDNPSGRALNRRVEIVIRE